jgi:glycosyltransferase involved in cell wall biosynthesis
LPWSGIVGRIAGRIAGVPVIYTEHNLQERYHWLTRLMNLLTIGMNTKVLAVSNNVGESIRKNKSPHFPVKIIHNGVDTCRFRKNGRVSAETVIDGGSSKAGLTIGNVAVFTPKKRLDVWLRVASDILRSFPETHFLLVGDGPERKRLEQLAKHLGIQRSVHFTGLQREIKPLLEKMDIFLMTSEFEGLPVALLEAMSMEKAVSVTDAGGIKEVVNYHNGMIAEPGDYELILKNTLKLLKNEQLRLQLGELARKTVIEKFD